MSLNITIRPETDDDTAAIHDITVAAFADLEISNHTEQFIVEALRLAHALTVSLVAEVDGRLVGHIAFSPITLSDGTKGWYGLGPVSVAPDCQRQGIGTALIEEGLSRLKKLGAHGCCLVGHPEYYPRFGFRNRPELTLDGVPPYAFFALSYDSTYPTATVTFHEAFAADISPK
ncbi:N-acetyltransferase [Rhodospirillaceae bacterium KN72]|uniref:N-acetyltransferase n=1 Tax=Pacificispira spongiicola TaxID=2729598 RepID=A0A7Y0DYV6_9PROT|nr:N-acetyltransferase [Pacificispira spongiicola]NMM44127.1 N-acetyltransferase [Pacificispira spongiicola]